MITAAVLTISDSAARGSRPDTSGPAIREKVKALGWQVVGTELMPDEKEQITRRLIALADGGYVNVIFTTGGTGLAARDVTPEATKEAIEREIPGLGELMRAEGRKSTRFAPLSRGMAGTRGRTLIVNLPGSSKGAADSFEAVAGLVPHIVDLLLGKTEHPPPGKQNS